MESTLGHKELEQWIRKVSEEFYQSVYGDQWLKQVFLVPQDHITSQQVDFVLAALGGPKRYSGRNPGDAHTHIFINEEMWNRREELLNQAFKTVNCPIEIQNQWLKIENAFKGAIVMKSPLDCLKRYQMDEIICVYNPDKKSA